MLKGGYQIIDLSRFKFLLGSSVDIGVDIYNICVNTKKAILVSGLTVDGELCKDSFAEVSMNESNVVLKALSGYTIEINSYGVAEVYYYIQNGFTLTVDYDVAMEGTSIEVPNSYNLTRQAINSNAPIFIKDSGSANTTRYSCSKIVIKSNTIEISEFDFESRAVFEIGTDNIIRRIS